MNLVALLDSTNTVINVALWDGIATWNPVGENGCVSTVDTTSQPTVTVGWTYADGGFSPPADRPVTPDPPGFGQAILTNSGITLATRLLVASWVPAIQIALQAGADGVAGVATITLTWSDLVAAYEISSADQSLVAATAASFGIPGISA